MTTFLLAITGWILFNYGIVAILARPVRVEFDWLDSDDELRRAA